MPKLTDTTVKTSAIGEVSDDQSPDHPRLDL